MFGYSWVVSVYRGTRKFAADPESSRSNWQKITSSPQEWYQAKGYPNKLFSESRVPTQTCRYSSSLKVIQAELLYNPEKDQPLVRATEQQNPTEQNR